MRWIRDRGDGVCRVCGAGGGAGREGEGRAAVCRSEVHAAPTRSGTKATRKARLDEVGSKLSAAEIREWITDAKGMTAKMKTTRKPEMKACSLPKEDVDALVAYLGSLKK